MKKLFIILFVIYSTITLAQPYVYYVSPWTGNDADSGLDTTNAWATWQKAFNEADTGDTVYFRGGTWYPTTESFGNIVNYVKAQTTNETWNTAGQSGTSTSPICFFNYPGEKPILDCKNVTSTSNYLTALNMQYVNFVKFRGLEIKNVYQKREGVEAQGISLVYGSNAHFENMTVHDIGGRGWTYFGANGYFGIDYDTTTFLNCDAYNCRDSLVNNLALPGHIGGKGDGWKCDLQANSLIIFRGCRSMNNSDDGYDPTGSGKMIFDRSWAIGNGYFDGDGCGLKYGGVSTITSSPVSVITNSLFAYNRDYGLVDLSNYPYSADSRVYNNTAYKNGVGISIISPSTEGVNRSIYRNNISFLSTTNNAAGWDADIEIYNFAYTESNNTWNQTFGEYPYYEVATDITVTTADFVLISDSTAVMAELYGARESDGSLPYPLTAFHLAEGSDLINYGIGVGINTDGDNRLFDDDTISIGAFQYASKEAPEPEEPTIATTITSDASYIKSIQALLGGNVTSSGGAAITQRGIVWGTSVNPTTSNNKIVISGTTGSYTTTLTGLSGNTTYHVRSYATNSAGTSYGSDVSFTTDKSTGVKVGTKPIYHNNKQITIK